MNNQFHVPNAGLVLINSYIPLLFDRLGLTAEGTFVSMGARQKAVMYLHFLAYGTNKADETQLLLNKLLCGIPVTEPVPTEIETTESDNELIEGLLLAVIQYWSAIGNSSIQGLRGSWFIREGILLQNESNFDLQVEQKAYDILLDRAPFSYSIVKMPWMQKSLHVQWRE